MCLEWILLEPLFRFASGRKHKVLGDDNNDDDGDDSDNDDDVVDDASGGGDGGDPPNNTRTRVLYVMGRVGIYSKE